MRPVKDIKHLIENAKIKINPEVKKAALNELVNELDQTKNINPAELKPDKGRIVMNNRIIKLFAAASIIIIISIGINQLGGPINFTSVAWGQIVKHIGDITYFHYYEIENFEDDSPFFKEGWYSNGSLRSQSYNSGGGSQTFDDGTTLQSFDQHNNITNIRQSNIGEYNNIFEAMISDLLSFNYKQFQDKTPSLIGEDFLIYEFEPSGEEADWIEKISVTVGKNSLIPLQIKTYYKTEAWYNSISQLLIFDYEEPQKKDEFFEPPTEIKPPNGVGFVILGGEEAEIDINDAPGIKKAIVKLHTKFDGPAEDLPLPWRDRYKLIGQPMYFMEITFILDNGYRSNTAKECPLWLDQAVNGGLGKKDTWPDGIYRNIRYSPVLRETDKQNEFILELSCWLRIKQSNL